MKTRGFSAAKPQMVQPSTMETANKDFIFHLVERLQTSAPGDQGSTFLISLEPRRLRKVVRKVGEGCELRSHAQPTAAVPTWPVPICYLGILGSTRSAQAKILPARLWTF